METVILTVVNVNEWVYLWQTSIWICTWFKKSSLQIEWRRSTIREVGVFQLQLLLLYAYFSCYLLHVLYMPSTKKVSVTFHHIPAIATVFIIGCRPNRVRVPIHTYSLTSLNETNSFFYAECEFHVNSNHFEMHYLFQPYPLKTIVIKAILFHWNTILEI